MEKLDKPDDKLFKMMLEDIENDRTILRKILPVPIRDSIDFEGMVIDNSVSVSSQFKENLADVVVRTTIKTTGEARRNTDIYILMEHKSYRDSKVLVQLLMYMATMWQKDIKESKPLRVIIPLVFYHGEKEWNVPLSFAEQFDVDKDIKGFLLDYRYILFDTNKWNMWEESNEDLRNNVFLFSAMALMKMTYNEDIAGLEALFRYWYRMGFIREKEKLIMFLMYISEVRNMDPDQLKSILENSNIEGGEFMQTLAQRLRDEGRQEGERENKIEIAKQLLLDGVSVEKVKKYTGLKEEEIKRLFS